MSSALSIDHLTIEYTRGGYKVRAIDDMNVEADDGDLALLLGPSGCGKTTVLSCLAGLLTPTKGEIRLGQTTVTELEGAWCSSSSTWFLT